jgi:hypothetical protein
MFRFKTLTTQSAIRDDLFIAHLATEKEISVTEKLEVWASTPNEGGDDFCEFRFFKTNETIPFKTSRINGH